MGVAGARRRLEGEPLAPAVEPVGRRRDEERDEARQPEFVHDAREQRHREAEIGGELERCHGESGHPLESEVPQLPVVEAAGAAGARRAISPPSPTDPMSLINEALKKAQEDNKDSSKSKSGKSGKSGKQGDQKLLELIHELKMVRALQKRVNDRTVEFKSAPRASKVTEAFAATAKSLASRPALKKPFADDGTDDGAVDPDHQAATLGADQVGIAKLRERAALGGEALAQGAQIRPQARRRVGFLDRVLAGEGRGSVHSGEAHQIA